MRHMKLLLAKCGSLLRVEVSWVRAELGGVWRLEGDSCCTSVRMGDSCWEVRCFYFMKLVCNSWEIQRLALLKFLW